MKPQQASEPATMQEAVCPPSGTLVHGFQADRHASLPHVLRLRSEVRNDGRMNNPTRGRTQVLAAELLLALPLLLTLQTLEAEPLCAERSHQLLR